MNKYDGTYSEHYRSPNADYPLGSAVDASTQDSFDGTPYKAAFFNDVIGFMQAAFFGAYGQNARVTGEPDNARKSDVWNAIKKYIADQGSGVSELIPDAASADNKLTDRNFVVNLVDANAARYMGTFNNEEALANVEGVSNNDYALVRSADDAGNAVLDVYTYTEADKGWKKEWSFFNNSFTKEQMETLESAASRAEVDQLRTTLDELRSEVSVLKDSKVNWSAEDADVKTPSIKEVLFPKDGGDKGGEESGGDEPEGTWLLVSELNSGGRKFGTFVYDAEKDEVFVASPVSLAVSQEPEPEDGSVVSVSVEDSVMEFFSGKSAPKCKTGTANMYFTRLDVVETEREDIDFDYPPEAEYDG